MSNTQNQRGRPIWIWGLLAVSLGINMFLVGHWAGGRAADNRPSRVFDAKRQGPPPQDLVRGVLMAFSAELSKEDQRAIRQALSSRRKALVPQGRSLWEAQAKVDALLRAEVIDKDALRVAFQDLRQSTNALQKPLHEALIDVAGQLSPSVRNQLLDKITAERRARRADRRRIRREGRLPPNN
ncbi:MAG: periplasmic heavy metal sensor [Pseudomonadota bacterium]